MPTDTGPASEEQSELEDADYRSGGSVNAPVNPGELGLSLVTGAALPYGISQAMHHGSHYISKNERAQAAKNLSQTGMTPGAQERLRQSYIDAGRTPEKAESLVKRKISTTSSKYSPTKSKKIVERAWRADNPTPTVNNALKTYMFPTLPSMAIGGALSAFRPLSDSKYKRGERGYVSSWWEGQKGDAEQIGQKAKDVKDRYGPVLGAPLQVFHGLTNPIASLIHGGQAVKDYFTGKQAALRVAHADDVIRRAIAVYKS